MRMAIVAVALLSLATSSAVADTAPAPKSGQSAPGHSYVRRFEDAQFRALNPAMSPGAQAAILWGDPNTGPSAVLFQMGRGATPLHIHSSTYHLVVIQGTMKHWVRGESEDETPPLGPGSYWYIAGGRVHADSCLSEVCVAFIRWDGKRDGQLVEGQ